MYLQRASPHVLGLRLDFPKARHHVKILLILLSNLIRCLCTNYHSFRLFSLLDFVVLRQFIMDIDRGRPALEAHLLLFPAIRVVLIHEVLLLLLFLALEELVSMDLADLWPESF